MCIGNLIDSVPLGQKGLCEYDGSATPDLSTG